ncbi:bacillithiol biosynthesis deacetylase BshB1 [Chitinophaga sedimenti]|uniref:bacillithiol biosynthesis deacetylase BshB1 n=1 Tax=Chitinophaga sedimenti TaxID=2033606 RepID=UPI00200545F5|nr:bacillithiol biosynthesis deacetylase BshB1 [Chitinophaga sedimenti]MCK7554574.1 bacillithiol biosynthesis deacetylase BshB1 [Chitinophaga sedimenti]
MIKLDILAIAAHPDDVELACAGTLLAHNAQGLKTGIVDLTRGELGTRGTPETRQEEASAAAKVLGVEVRENPALKDGFFRNDTEEQLAIITAIRKYRPDIVLANAIDDRHPDHGRAAKLIADSCFMAGLRRIETSVDGVAQEAWRPKQVFHFIQDRYHEPDFVLDITPYMEQKIEAIKCFKTQFWPPAITSRKPIFPDRDSSTAWCTAPGCLVR